MLFPQPRMHCAPVTFRYDNQHEFIPGSTQARLREKGIRDAEYIVEAVQEFIDFGKPTLTWESILMCSNTIRQYTDFPIAALLAHADNKAVADIMRAIMRSNVLGKEDRLGHFVFMQMDCSRRPIEDAFVECWEEIREHVPTSIMSNYHRLFTRTLLRCFPPRLVWKDRTRMFQCLCALSWCREHRKEHIQPFFMKFLQQAPKVNPHECIDNRVNVAEGLVNMTEEPLAFLCVILNKCMMDSEVYMSVEDWENCLLQAPTNSLRIFILRLLQVAVLTNSIGGLMFVLGALERFQTLLGRKENREEENRILEELKTFRKAALPPSMMAETADQFAYRWTLHSIISIIEEGYMRHSDTWELGLQVMKKKLKPPVIPNALECYTTRYALPPQATASKKSSCHAKRRKVAHRAPRTGTTETGNGDTVAAPQPVAKKAA